MNEDYLEHHSILGQRWGIRRYQNPDGTLTEKGKKRLYKQSLRKDKSIRRGLETKTYDSQTFANKYYDKLKEYSIEYEKATSKDSKLNETRINRIKNSKDILEKNFNSWNQYNSSNVRQLKEHVDNMINKYSNTKIKDIDVKKLDNGVEFVDSIGTAMNYGAYYYLSKRSEADADHFVPVKAYAGG